MATVIQHGEEVRPFEFTGSGGEYFRIWIVNLALTILTLGIYSAWAKVRRLQYFYRNTTIAGSSFDYHGNPMAILKGRVIGILLLVGYNVMGGVHWGLGLIALALLLSIMPWLIQRSLRFKLTYSSYRGLRFRFTGSLGGAYQAFLLWPIVGYITLFILMPMAHREIKAYQHNNSLFGDTAFSFDAGVGKFYGVYLKALGMVLLAGFTIGVTFVLLTPVMSIFTPDGNERDKASYIGWIFFMAIGFYFLLFLFIGPWFSARMQNLVWNHTALGPHAFQSDVRARDLFWIYLTNFLGILMTLGLYKPFADIRLARYRLAHTALRAQSDLDEFIATQESAVNALGEETADVFDVDISF